MATEAAGGKEITLKCSDGKEFRVSEAAARQSVRVKGMIEEGVAGDNPLLLDAVVASQALDMVIKYCNKHVSDPSAATTPVSDPSAAAGSSSSSVIVNAAASEELEKWDRELVDGLGQDALYDLLMAADYLDIQGLVDAVCQKVADMIKGKTPAQIRTTFNIVSDLTTADEQEIRSEFAWAVFDD